MTAADDEHAQEGGAHGAHDDAPVARVDARELPDGVRQRAIRYACDALGRLPADQVPAPLRRAASFAPSRRARIVGDQVLQLLDDDETFRSRMATQVAADATEVRAQVAEVESGGAAPDGAARNEAAAVAYLVDSSATRGLVDVAVAAEQAASRVGSELDQTVERLQQQLVKARGEAKDQRERHRRELDRLKSDNQTLRRTLGQTRLDLRAAEEERDRTREEAEAQMRRLSSGSRQADAELRRLRARVAELEEGLGQARRAARDDRDAEVTRLRLLLDTIVGAAGGLRRELALGPAEVLPADRVSAVEGGERATGPTSALQDDPRLLRRWLSLPRVHLVVDGYNVSKTAWATAPLDQQRARLVSALGALVAGSSVEATVVFDGADVVGVPSAPSARGVRVRFSPPGVIADDTVRAMVEAEPAGRVVVVVSSDRELAVSAVARGARSATTHALLGLLGV